MSPVRSQLYEGFDNKSQKDDDAAFVFTASSSSAQATSQRAEALVEASGG